MNSADGFSMGPLEELLRMAPRAVESTSGVPPTPDCPSEADWFRAATGESSPHEALKMVEHASRCQACEPLLHYWGNILREESPEEIAEAEKLPVSRPRWQERVADRMIRKESQTRPAFFSRRFLLPASLGLAGALAAVAFFALLPSGFRTHASPELQLASAYSERRQMDLRIPMASYSPVEASHRTRSAGGSASPDSVPLLEARAAITQALLKSPEDNHWRTLKARADLLNSDYNSAIDTLTRVLAAEPSNVAAMTDIASAYHQRAAITDTPSDQATALDYLERAERLQPHDSVILYNEALILDALCQYAVEIDTWNKFLLAEKDRKWLQDGRNRLQSVESREKECDHNQSLLTPYLGSPDGMFQLARSPDLLALHDEELFTLSLPRLLQTSFPQSNSATGVLPACDRPCAAARQLLGALAASLVAHHRDGWLRDFLTHEMTPGFADSAQALAATLAADARGDVGSGMKLADTADAMFKASGNRAGQLRVEAERIFALGQLFLVDRCLAAVRRTVPDFATVKYPWDYPWLHAQFALDASSCAAAKSDFTSATAGIAKASDIAEQSGYAMISLRALGFLADEEYFSGHRRAAWKTNLEGLHRFWHGNYPLMRANQFYSNLTYDEEATPNLYASVLFNRELLHLSSQLHHPSYEAADRFRLIKAEVRAGELAEAASQLPAAEAFFASIPGANNLQGYDADTHLQLANAYLASREPDAARRMLSAASEAVTAVDVPYVNLSYEEATGRLAMEANQLAEGRIHLDRALAIAEANFRRLDGREARAAWSRNVREAYAASTLLRLEENEPAAQALAVWERYRMMSSGLDPQSICQQAGFECLAPALERLSQSLGGACVLGTTLLDRNLIVWSIGHKGIAARRVPIDPQSFHRLVQTFSNLAATPTSSEGSLRAVGLELLQGPLQPMLPFLVAQQRILIDLDDTMDALPFAALPLPGGGYVGQRIALSNVRSLLAVRRHPEPATGPALVIGASLPDPAEASPLPEAKTEALSVAAYLDRPRILIGEAATSHAMAQAVPGSWLIHYAGHALSSSGQTRLVLAHDPGQQVAEARLFREDALRRCRLVVLSACSTGRQEDAGFPEPSTLVDQLAEDGVPDIVATHWDVDSEAAVPLMNRFYAGLAQGLTVPLALSRAEVAISSRASYHHPYYWAAYYVTGMGELTWKERIHDRTDHHPADNDRAGDSRTF